MGQRVDLFESRDGMIDAMEKAIGGKHMYEKLRKGGGAVKGWK